MNVGKAHQRKIREQKEKTDAHSLFGADWEYINKDISNAVIKEVSYATAKAIIEEYEWLKCMPANVKYCYGIYFDNICAGVTVFGSEYAENIGVWDKYDYTGRILLLARGACVHWAHPHTASKLIMGSIKLLPKKYDVITCTTDPLAGEVGTIYQACNFYYIGSMRDSNPNVKSKKFDRFGVLINGKMYGARGIRAKIGTQKKEEILKYFPDAKFINQHSKRRYFHFRGSKSNVRYLKSKIEHLLKPYPKRNA